jgi:hypothetical protein
VEVKDIAGWTDNELYVPYRYSAALCSTVWTVRAVH